MMELDKKDEHIATLVYPDEYAKNVSQIASVSSQMLIYVKRRELAMTPFDLLYFSMDECSTISYQVKWAIISMIFGAALIALVIFIMLSDVQAGTSVPVGALAVALIFGGILLKNPKRHCITFVVSGKNFQWKSKAGDFKYKLVSVQKVVDFAKASGRYRDVK